MRNFFHCSVLFGLLLILAGLLTGCAGTEPEPMRGPAPAQMTVPPPQSQGPPPVAPPSADVKAHGVVVNVTLNRVNDAVVAGVFGKVLRVTPGVARVERQPGSQRAAQVVWNAHVGVNDPFKLRVDIIKTLKEIFRTNGRVVVAGVTHHYTPAEVQMLRRVVPDNGAPRGVSFSVVQNPPPMSPPSRR